MPLCLGEVGLPCNRRGTTLSMHPVRNGFLCQIALRLGFMVSVGGATHTNILICADWRRRKSTHACACYCLLTAYSAVRPKGCCAKRTMRIRTSQGNCTKVIKLCATA